MHKNANSLHTCASGPVAHDAIREHFRQQEQHFDVQPLGPVGRLTVAHRAELIGASAIAPALALSNFRSFGPGTDLHWEDVREELLEARLAALADAGSGQAGDRYQSQLKERRKYEHLAAGGWALYGHDPSDYSRRILLCVKPNQPRIVWPRGAATDAPGKPVKYETCPERPDRVMLLSVPATSAAAIAQQAGLELPPEVAADADGSQGAIWAWAAQEPRLGRHLTEGGKKTASGISHGRLTIGATGCWNFAPKDGDRYVDPLTGDRVRMGRPRLHPDLQGWAWKDCPAVVIFDRPARKGPGAAEHIAGRRTASLLRRTGADVRFGTVPGPEKGLDDWLAAGKTWDALLEHLAEAPALPVVPRRPAPHVTAPPDRYLSEVVTIPSPEQARLVCLTANMGAGKTVLIQQAIADSQAVGTPVLMPSHRVNLGAATARTLGIPWGDEARPGQPLRRLGIGCCFDSLCPESALQVNAAGWAGSVIVLDEVAQGLRHLLMATGTAIATRRAAVLATFVQLLRSARQVICADAQMPQFVVTALELLMGTRAYVIASDRQPFADVPAKMFPTRKALQAHLARMLLQEQARIWINTTAQKDGEKNGTVALEQWVRKMRPDLQVLRVDSDTQADPNHDAARLAEDPEAIARQYDVIVCSPAVAAGLSVPATVPFDAVVGFSGGTIEPEQFVQAQARVRYNCPRLLYAPEKAAGKSLRVGGGDFTAQRVLTHVVEAGTLTIRQLVAAGAELELPNATGALLQLWAEFGATSNGQRLSYAATVGAYLEREGFAVDVLADDLPSDLLLEEIINTDLKAIAEADRLAYEQAVIDTPLPSREEMKQLGQKRRLTRDERVKKYRYDLAQRWGLGDRQPTRQLLEADDDNLSERLRWGWVVRTPEAQTLARQGDLTVAAQQASSGRVWLPDLCRETMTAWVGLAQALEVADWLQRTDEFTADDPKLQRLHALMTAYGSGITQVMDVAPGKEAHTSLRRLLRAHGYQLTTRRRRVGDGSSGDNRQVVYRVEPTPLPEVVAVHELEAVWRQQLQDRIKTGTGLLSTKIPNKSIRERSRPADPVSVGGQC